MFRTVQRRRHTARQLTLERLEDRTAPAGLSLDYFTLLSGTSSTIRGMVSDSAGDLYVTGLTSGPGFLTTPGAYQTTFVGGFDSAFVAKLSPQGQILWSTLFGAPGAGDTYAYAIALDSQGDVYISGRAAPGLPTTPGAFQPYYDGVVDLAHGRDNGFVAKFSPDGAHLLWASYLGTGDDVRDIKVDASGNVYALTDYTPGGSPAAPPAAWFVNGFQTGPQGGGDALVVKISADGTRVLAGTYLSGSGNELAGIGGLALDATGVYVAFPTTSTNLPTPSGYQRTYGGGSENLYVGKLSLDLSRLNYGTYVGGTGGDVAQTHEITVDAQGDVYLALYTSSPNLPTTPGAYLAQFPGGSGATHVYVAKIAADGSSLLGATYLGGSGSDLWPDGPSVDAQGNVYVGFSTTSNDIPTTPDALQRTNAGNANGYLAKLSADFTTLLYGTYLGGGEGTEANRDILVDTSGNVYWAGDTTSGDFPTANALQRQSARGDDAFLVKFAPTTAPTVMLSANPTSYAGPATILLSVTATAGDGASVSRVDLYANNELIGTSSTASTGDLYLFAWSDVSAGGYSLTAVATTDQGATATSNAVEVTVTGAANIAPVIVTPASSDANFVTPYSYGNLFAGTTDPATKTQLRVTANDDGGESNLKYTWTVQSKPAGASDPTFGPTNGTNAGKNTTVTFHAAGAYTFLATVRDQGGLSATSTVSVTAAQALTSVTVSGPASVDSNGTAQFTAVARDQFGQPLAEQPRFLFTTSGGTISNEGLFTAPAAGGSYQIQAFSAVAAPQIGGSAHITVVTAGNQPPSVATPARATVSSNAAVYNLSVLGADPTGEANLIYTWGTIDSPSYSAPVTFGSTNGTNAGKNTTATFATQGGFGAAVHLVVTISNPTTGLSVTSPVTVTVSPTFTIVVTPGAAFVPGGAAQQFSAVALDQFGNVSLPSFSWSIAGGVGAVSGTGLYTAPADVPGSATVRATFSSVSGSLGLSGTANVTVIPQPADPGFETPDVGGGTYDAFRYDPSGSPWAFSGSAGVSGNGSGFTAANPDAPQGNQVAFLQGTGTVSQAVSFAAGTYGVSFLAAQRAGNTTQTFAVLVDGVVVGTFTPAGTGYAAYTTDRFPVLDGSHTISFVGLDPDGQDNTAFLDQVEIDRVLAGYGFELPDVGTGYQYDPTGTPLTYTDTAGVAGNGSALTAGNPDAPQGTQAGFLEGTGGFSATGTFAAGTYSLNFLAAQRAGNPSSQTFAVVVDGIVVGTFTPSSTAYAAYSTNNFTLTAGVHTVAFIGLDPDGLDDTALIDQVALGVV